MSSFTEQLQRIVDQYRATCAKQLPPSLRIANVPGIAAPIDLDVIPDGVSWLVTIKCGERVLLPQTCVDPEHFLAHLYTNLVAVVRALRATPEKPS